MSYTTAWTDAEIAILKREWAGAKPVKTWDCLPGRSERAIYGKAQGLGLPPRKSHDHRGECATWRLIERALSDGTPRTVQQIARLTGLNRSHIDKQIKAHRGSVYVADYTLGRNKHRLWKLGKGEDVPKPAPLTHGQVTQRWWRRMKADRPEFLDARNAKRRLKRIEKSGKLIRRDPAAAWIQPRTTHIMHDEPEAAQV